MNSPVASRRPARPLGATVPVPDSLALLAALPVPVVVLDAENRFRFANPAAEQFFQLSAGTLAQMGLADLIPADTRLFALVAQVRLQVDGQGLTTQWLRSGSAGQSVQLAASGQQIHNQLQIDLVRQSLPATANLQRDVAQAIGLNRGVGI